MWSHCLFLISILASNHGYSSWKIKENIHIVFTIILLLEQASCACFLTHTLVISVRDTFFNFTGFFKILGWFYQHQEPSPAVMPELLCPSSLIKKQWVTFWLFPGTSACRITWIKYLWRVLNSHKDTMKIKHIGKSVVSALWCCGCVISGSPMVKVLFVKTKCSSSPCPRKWSVIQSDGHCIPCFPKNSKYVRSHYV